MEVTQAYTLVNNATQEILGESGVIQEDLSNIVDVGAAILNNNSFDKFTGKLVDKVGRVVFGQNRKYRGYAPDVTREAWEYGAIMQKINIKMPDASINEDWNLTDGESYDPFIFHSTGVESTFFNKRFAYEIDASITEKQVKSAFNSRAELVSFVSVIENTIETSMIVKRDAMIMRGINSLIADTINADYAEGSDSYSTKSGKRAINLLYMYNNRFGTTLTKDKALTDPEFLRFAAFTINNYADYMRGLSSQFNIEGMAKFTADGDRKTVMLSTFSNACKNFLLNGANVYNTEYIQLPQHETVPYWQGAGDGASNTAYTFEELSRINVKSADGATVDASGILGVMFDRDAVMHICEDREINTQYNAKANFTNYFYKQFAGLITALDENFIVFFVA